MTDATTRSGDGRGSQLINELLTTLVAIILAFAVGAVLMIVSDPAVISQYAYLFTAPQLPLGRQTAAPAQRLSKGQALLAPGAQSASEQKVLPLPW